MTPSSSLSVTNSPASYVSSTTGISNTKPRTDSTTVASAAASPSALLQISAQALNLYSTVPTVAATTSYTVAQALKLGATATAASLAISDTAANIGANFDKLVAINSKISAITQTDIKAVAVTEAQFSAGLSTTPQTGLLSKINSGQFKVAVSGVRTANLGTVSGYGTKVESIAVGDTSANIQTKLADIAALGTQVRAITQTTKSTLTMSYADTQQYAAVLAKIDNGAYTLNLSDTSGNIKTNLAAITKLGTKVATITQTDSSTVLTVNAATLSANLSTLQKISKVSVEDTAAAISNAWTTISGIQKNVSNITLTDATPTLTLTAAKAITGTDLLNKISNPALKLTVADSAANIAANFDKLVAINSKISAITQTDTKAVAVTEAQFSAGTAQNGLLSKINGGQFKVAVSGVHTANLSAVSGYGTKVESMTIGDTSTNIQAKFADIAALGTQVRAITQTTKSTLTMSYADTQQYAAVLAKMDNGGYTLNLNDTSGNIKTNLAAITKLGAKVATITQTDSSTVLTISATTLTANLSTLQKINKGSYKVSLEDTGAAISNAWSTISDIQKNVSSITLTDATPALTLTAARAIAGTDLLNKVSNSTLKLTVADSAANLSASLSGLMAMGTRLTNLTQTGTGNIAVTQSQLTSSPLTSLLAKFSPTAYSLAVSDVDEANMVNTLSNSRVKAVSLNLTGGAIGSSDPARNMAFQSSKITSIVVSNAKIADLDSLSADTRIKSIGITDSAANLGNTTNLNAIDALMKKNPRLISAVNVDVDTHPLLTVAQANYTKYAATVFAAPKNYALEVDLGSPSVSVPVSQLRNALKVTANSNGSFGIQVWDFTKGTYSPAVTLNAGVNFVKFGGASTFLDSGDAKLNAVLNVGTFKWQQNPAQVAATTSGNEIKAGVFSLGNGSAATTITYKFLSSASDPGLSINDKKGFTAMNSDQENAVKSALNYISSLVNVTFQLVTSGTADINFGTNNQGTTSGGYATGSNPALGTVNLMLNNQASVNTKPKPGDYGWETILHEVGHTLGLKHPGSYNAGGGTTAGPYLSTADDNRRNTIMSYKAAADGAYNWVSTGTGSYTSSGVSPTTYMPLDILALQFLYGKNQTGVSTTDTSKNLSNTQTTTFTSSWLGMETLASAAGGLSLDLSSLSAANIVDLRAGAFSSINIKDSNYNIGVGGANAQTFFNLNNVGLAYGSAVKSLVGGSSSDVVYVSEKNVEIDAGSGNDTVYLYGSASDWTQSQTADQTIYTNGSVTAKLKNVETIAFYSPTTSPTTHTRLNLIT